MTGNRRAAASPLLTVSCAALICLLGGCAGFKQVVGLEAQAPDEFAVESRAPLTIPPEFDLRPPAPGAPRPQEKTAAAAAQQAVNAAGPGQPGDQASGVRLGGTLGGGPDLAQQLAPGSLARKLLTSNDVDTGVAIEKRETTPLQGVY